MKSVSVVSSALFLTFFENDLWSYMFAAWLYDVQFFFEFCFCFGPKSKSTSSTVIKWNNPLFWLQQLTETTFQGWTSHRVSIKYSDLFFRVLLDLYKYVWCFYNRLIKSWYSLLCLFQRQSVHKWYQEISCWVPSQVLSILTFSIKNSAT